jgi:Asp-tRNA(Asn)/Glu-tRNA(Gln) amidotransferase A subunit family amidase
MNRRELLKRLGLAGVAAPILLRAIVTLVDDKSELTLETLKQAQWISGVEMSDEEMEEVVSNVNRNSLGLEQLREVELSEDVPLAIHFSPITTPDPIKQLDRSCKVAANDIDVPEDDESIAFLPVTQLAELVRQKKISSVRLTNIYLERLKKYGPMLRCVVTLTEALAMEQAKRADAEIAEGKYRGPLHGIPWGAKDLIAVPGYPTSWGIPYHKERELDSHATVAKRLNEAGAVLVAKLSLGALAMGDKWFEGMTRNPWNPRVGSSGSSAGSASAVVAGLVGFTLGSETLGSILSPSIRCGASSLRPTFGRVSRHGCMPLSWSMDKIGPLCRSIEDCAIVFNTIHGSDGLDPTAGTYEFKWPSQQDLGSLRVGYSKRRRANDEDLEILKELGCEMVEISLPTDIPLRPLTNIIDIEAASVFEDLLKAGHTEGWNTWPKSFRAAQFVSAVDYVRIQRSRSILMQRFEEAITDVDIMINMNDLVHTNFTGHPSVVMPFNFRERGDAKFARPTVLTGHLHDDERLLAFANAFQSKLDTQHQHPNLDPWLDQFNAGTMDKPEKPKEPETEQDSKSGAKTPDSTESDSKSGTSGQANGKSGKDGK